MSGYGGAGISYVKYNKTNLIIKILKFNVILGAQLVFLEIWGYSENMQCLNQYWCYIDAVYFPFPDFQILFFSNLSH